MTRVYEVQHPKFGTVPFVADSIGDAKVRAKRMFGRKYPVRRLHDYRACDLCGCAPCDCPKVERPAVAR